MILTVDDDVVGSCMACPKCGENRVDWLVWQDELVTCATCGTVYDPAEELGPDETREEN